MPVLKIKQNGQWLTVGDGIVNANTLDGNPVSYFATISDIDDLKKQIGEIDVSEQIESAIEDSGHATIEYVDGINNINYNLYLAFDTTEIVSNKPI